MQKCQQSAAMGEGIWMYNILHCFDGFSCYVIGSPAQLQNLDSQTLALYVLSNVTTQGALEL